MLAFLDEALEAEQTQALTGQIEDLDRRIAALHAQADPAGVVATAPGVGPVVASTIVGRLGDPHRFSSLAAVRAYSGLVPAVSESGLSGGSGRLTKAGDPLLREALFQAADNARHTDPQLAARYVRLISTGHHHDSAVCHLATTLLTRITACWRSGEPYLIRDTHGREISADEGRRIVAEHHQVPKRTRLDAGNHRQAERRKQRAGQEPHKSQDAPGHLPAKAEPPPAKVA